MVKVNQKTCIGCGSCASICPEVFEMRDTPKGERAFVKGDGKADCVKEAKESCPVDAIS